MADLATVVARNVRARRAWHGWTQAQLAERLNVGQTTVSAIEGGTRGIGLDFLPRLCRALDVSLLDLFAGADPDDMAALRL